MKFNYTHEEILTPLRKQRKQPYTQLDVYGKIVYSRTMVMKKQESSFWTPEKENDELEGKVIAVIEGNFGKQYVLNTTDGKKVTTPSHAVLQSGMVSVKEGDTVKLVFTGTSPAKKKGHSDTKLYDVFIDE